MGRAAWNVFGESTLGMIVTRGNPDGSGATNPTRGRAYDETTMTGGGRNSTTVGTDFLYRNTNFRGTGRTFRASLWWAKSIDDNHLSAGRNNGYGVKLEYPNDRINWIVGFEELQEDYAPRLGFVNRNDIRHSFNSFRYRTRPKSGPFRTIDNEIFGQVFVDSGNQLETVNLRVVPAEFTTAIDDGFDVRYLLRHELVRPTDFIPTIDVPADDYTFHEAAFRFFTSRNRPVRLETEVGWGTFFDGTRTRVDASLEFRPSHYLFVEVEYEFADINLPKRRGLAPGDPDRNDRDTQLVRLKFDLLFTPNIVWSNFIQYDNRSDNAGINSRFRYILRDGREFFIVVNQNVDTDENRANLTRSESPGEGDLDPHLLNSERPFSNRAHRRPSETNHVRPHPRIPRRRRRHAAVQRSGQAERDESRDGPRLPGRRRTPRPRRFGSGPSCSRGSAARFPPEAISRCSRTRRTPAPRRRARPGAGSGTR